MTTVLQQLGILSRSAPLAPLQQVRLVFGWDSYTRTETIFIGTHVTGIEAFRLAIRVFLERFPDNEIVIVMTNASGQSLEISYDETEEVEAEEWLAELLIEACIERPQLKTQGERNE